MEDWLDPLYDAEGMRAADRWAIDERGIPSLQLMEAAGAAVAEAAAEVASAGPARVVCGKGNNGGDGLVAARHLARIGFEVETLLLWPADELSPDAAANLRQLEGGGRDVAAAEVAAALAGSGVVVDAIFGTGFAGAARAPADSAIEAINCCGAPVVAADIASGVDAASGEAAGATVDAGVTVTFHAAKLGHWIEPGKERTGELRVAPIGIPAGPPAKPAAGLIGDRVLALPRHRGAGSTKFTSGQVVIVGASRGLTGAVCMSAEAAIRTHLDASRFEFTGTAFARVERLRNPPRRHAQGRGRPAGRGNPVCARRERRGLRPPRPRHRPRRRLPRQARGRRPSS